MDEPFYTSMEKCYLELVHIVPGRRTDHRSTVTFLHCQAGVHSTASRTGTAWQSSPISPSALPQPCVIECSLSEDLVIESEYLVPNGHLGLPFPLCICPLIDLALHMAAAMSSYALRTQPANLLLRLHKYDKWPVKTFLLCFKYTIQQKLYYAEHCQNQDDMLYHKYRLDSRHT